MKILLDTHTHTLASTHAYSTVLEMAKYASEAGMEAIAITDHAPATVSYTHLVGDIVHVKHCLIDLLSSDQYIPVIAPIGTDEDGNSYNINACLLYTSRCV